MSVLLNCINCYPSRIKKVPNNSAVNSTLIVPFVLTKTVRLGGYLVLCCIDSHLGLCSVRQLWECVSLVLVVVSDVQRASFCLWVSKVVRSWVLYPAMQKCMHRRVWETGWVLFSCLSFSRKVGTPVISSAVSSGSSKMSIIFLIEEDLCAHVSLC